MVRRRVCGKLPAGGGAFHCEGVRQGQLILVRKALCGEREIYWRVKRDANIFGHPSPACARMRNVSIKSRAFTCTPISSTLHTCDVLPCLGPKGALEGKIPVYKRLRRSVRRARWLARAGNELTSSRPRQGAGAHAGSGGWSMGLCVKEGGQEKLDCVEYELRTETARGVAARHARSVRLHQRRGP